MKYEVVHFTDKRVPKCVITREQAMKIAKNASADNNQHCELTAKLETILTHYKVTSTKRDEKVGLALANKYNIEKIAGKSIFDTALDILVEKMEEYPSIVPEVYSIILNTYFDMFDEIGVKIVEIPTLAIDSLGYCFLPYSKTKDNKKGKVV